MASLQAAVEEAGAGPLAGGPLIVHSQPKDPLSPLTSQQHLDHVTTRKRLMPLSETASPLPLNFESGFSLESPQPLKRHFRPAADRDPDRDTHSPWDLDPAILLDHNGDTGLIDVQHQGAGLSPAESECSSFVAEPEGSAGLTCSACKSIRFGRVGYHAFSMRSGPEHIGSTLQQQRVSMPYTT